MYPYLYIHEYLNISKFVNFIIRINDVVVYIDVFTDTTE